MTPRRRGFGFPLLLIAVGVVALLANLGYFTFSWSALLSLWPLILVIVGVDLLLAHRAPYAALAADIVVIALGIVLLVTQPLGTGWFPMVSFGGHDCGDRALSDTVSVPRASVQSATIDITGGAAKYRITGGATDLLNATSDQRELYTTTSGGSSVHLVQCNPAGFGGRRDVEVKLASDIPISLDVTGGAGTFDLQLADVKLSELDLTNGASTTTLDLPKPSGTVRIRVTGGASTITLQLNGAEASVDVSGGLTTLNTPDGRGGGSAAGRQTWTSSGYASASDKYTITVTGGVSTINVR